MALVIEDGTGVVGANSYTTVDEFRAYAQNRGVAVADAPSSGIDPAIATYTPLLIIACDYIESLSNWFSGCLLFPGVQELCFPRTQPLFNSSVVPLVIPNKLKAAQCQLVIEQLNGVALFPSQAGSGVGTIPDGPDGPIVFADGRVVIREKLDVIETQWSENIGVQSIPLMPAVDALLSPLMIDQGRFFTTVRL